MSKFKRINLKIKPQSLDKLLSEYLSGHAPSRASVAKALGVSSVTSGKVMDALISAGFMCGRIFSKNAERPATHLLFNDSSSVLVIDLSDSIYKMCVVNPSGKTLLTFSHIYDPEISFDDNLNIFISRNGLKLKQSKVKFATICVLYADDSRRSRLDFSVLPTISMSNYIDEVIYTILGKRGASHLTVSNAVSQAVKFNVVDIDPSSRGISYLFIGSSISSFHVYENGSVTLCSPENILSRDELADINNIPLISKEKADALFVRLADFMDAAFSPAAILLSSDILSPDRETSDRICHKFALRGRTAPIIYTRDSSFPLEYIGAARYALLSVVKQYITSTKE